MKNYCRLQRHPVQSKAQTGENEDDGDGDIVKQHRYN
jgi:hypothetical protein